MQIHAWWQRVLHYLRLQEHEANNGDWLQKKINLKLDPMNIFMKIEKFA